MHKSARTEKCNEVLFHIFSSGLSLGVGVINGVSLSLIHCSAAFFVKVKCSCTISVSVPLPKSTAFQSFSVGIPAFVARNVQALMGLVIGRLIVASPNVRPS